MTEQEKREKVIVELEWCLDDSVVAVVPADTVRDALALLKAHEPVDAIPVEWLEEQADYARSEWDFDTCEGIRIVLKAWQKEQEAR